MEYDDYVGRIGVGRVERGSVKVNAPYVLCRRDDTRENIRVTKLYQFEGLKRVPVEEAVMGDLICVAGIADLNIGETLCAPECVGPLPFATLANHEWGNIGTNYIRGLVALGLQGFLIMVITGIYAILVKSLSISGGDLHGAIWTCVAYTVLLCFSLFKSGSVAKSILTAH